MQRAPAVVAIDLCCGMGGLSLAARSLGITPICGVDVSPAALATFSHNFPEARALPGSVASVAVQERCREAADAARAGGAKVVVLSGPPCQGFSAAGPRDPRDPRNDVITHVARAVRRIGPDAAVVENVAAILSPGHAPRLAHFRRVLRGAGYSVCPVLLDAAHFGVPQRRRRVFFIVAKEQIQAEEITRALGAHARPPVGARAAFAGLPSAQPRGAGVLAAREVPNHVAMRHSQRVAEKIMALEPGSGPMSYRKLHPDRPSPTLISGHRAPPAHFCEGRSITVREAARLQALPDAFRVCGPFASQMEQVSNAVPLPLGQAVLRFVISRLGLAR